MRDDLSAQERAIIIRAHLASPGWQMEAAALQQKYEEISAQALLPPEERSKDFQKWSVDRIGGAAYGLGFALKFLKLWLDRYDEAERAAAEEIGREDIGAGHPYGDFKP